jgi:hypothetical protein
VNAEKPGAPPPAAPPPAAARAGAQIAWGKPAAGLRLGLAADGVIVTFTLENVSDKQIEILSHVAAQDKQLDWTTLRVAEAGA